MSLTYTAPTSSADYSSIVSAIQQSVLDLEGKTQADFETRRVTASGADVTAAVRSTGDLYEISLHGFASGQLEITDITEGDAIEALEIGEALVLRSPSDDIPLPDIDITVKDGSAGRIMAIGTGDVTITV